jgi:predicted AAA+ superfamily ATPase
MQSEDVRKRELAPLQKIRDNYPKIVLSPDPGPESSFDRIKSLQLTDWLLDA